MQSMEANISPPLICEGSLCMGYILWLLAGTNYD